MSDQVEANPKYPEALRILDDDKSSIRDELATLGAFAAENNTTQG